MAQIAAASAVTSSAVSLFGVCRDLASSIVKGINQMNLNDEHTLNCFLKTKLLKNEIADIETIYKECHWMSRATQRSLTIELEYVKSLLDNVCNRCSRLSTKQKMYKFVIGSGIRCLMETSFSDLLEVDNRLAKVKGQIKDIRANPMISPAVSEVDFHLPAQIRKVTTNQDGKYLVVNWEDTDNTPSNLEQYNIYVDDNIRTFYPVTTTHIQSNIHVHSARVPLDDWCIHTIQVSAVNKAREEGSKSDHMVVLMNQHPPNVKPTGVKVAAASSRTSVLFCVDRPVNYNDMEIIKCKIHGYANRRICIEREADCLESSDTIIFEIGDIDPAWDCQVTVCFCNEYGEGLQSDEIPFKIDSMHPSAPKLSSKQITSTIVKVEIFTEINPGNVLCYYLFQKQDKNKIVLHLKEPIKQLEDNPIFHDIDGLQPNTKYKFWVVSVSATDENTYESETLTVKTKAA